MSTDRLDGRVALVTGGASGIGAACVRALSDRGALVAVADIDHAAATELAAGLPSALAVRVDVTDLESVESMVSETVGGLGRLDIPVNNAGIPGEVAPIHEYTTDNWRRVLAVNLDGVFHCLAAEIRAMRTGGGSIINISSILGAVGTRGSVAYAAAKHGVVGLTRCAAIEYAEAGIRVNAVGPGRIRTPLLESKLDAAGLAAKAALAPMNRLGSPSEIAEVVAWLSGDGASFVTGAFLPADGGFLAG